MLQRNTTNYRMKRPCAARIASPSGLGRTTEASWWSLKVPSFRIALDSYRPFVVHAVRHKSAAQACAYRLDANLRSPEFSVSAVEKGSALL